MNWLFADMDAFFASVEIYLNPKLRGRPVGVVPLQSEYTCVIAASYDAKACGIKVGTKVGEARRLCPDIALVKARPAVYARVHRDVVKLFKEFAPIEKVESIDEWAIRLTGPQRSREAAVDLAHAMRRRMREVYRGRITCSIGIAPTRLLAKIASDLEKPDGVTAVSADELPGRFDGLRLKDLCGIGPGMRDRLARVGVTDVRGLWELSEDDAVRVWGSVDGARWWRGFHGVDEPRVAPTRGSMSHGKILGFDERNEDSARGILERFVYRLGRRLTRDGYYARHLSIAVRDEAGGVTRDEIGIPCAQDTPTLLQHFAAVWARRIPTAARPKKVEVCVSGLESAAQGRLPFAETEKLGRLS
ncbi:MAG: type VI secretion protein ImpB, partial [Planctomycetota bacterium]